MKYFYFLALLMFTFSCKNEVREFSCEEMEEIYESDQRLRKEKVMSPFFHLIDSLYHEIGYDFKNSNHPPKKKKKEIFARARILNDSIVTENKMIIDSLWNIQREIDLKNTNRLIEIIENNNFDFLIKQECFKKFSVIFVHSPKDKFAKIRSLIEKRKNLIPEGQFRHISWHINGRKNEDLQ